MAGGSAQQRARRAALLAVALIVAAPGCDPLRDFQREQVFRSAGRPAPALDPDAAEGLERWTLEVEDGARVEAIYLPATSGPTPGPAVIYAHGAESRIEESIEMLAPYRRMGLAVLLPEYRGYGGSGGRPGEAEILGDFAHFFDRLVDRPEIDGARVVLHGRSLGGGVVGALSDRRRAAALVLESTFTSVPDLASRWGAPMFVFTDRFDTRDVLMRSSTPALILHGVDDEHVPFRHAVELHRVAWDSRLVAYHAGHGDLPHTEAAYWSRIRAFLVEVGVIRPPPTAPTLSGGLRSSDPTISSR